MNSEYNFRRLPTVRLGRQRRTPLHMSCIDLQKAYDDVKLELLWEILARFCVPTQMLPGTHQFQDDKRVRLSKDNGGRSRNGCMLHRSFSSVSCGRR